MNPAAQPPREAGGSTDSIRSPSLKVIGNPKTATAPRIGLLDTLLREQQVLTAVTRFSELHESGAVPAQERYYRDLLPLSKPEAGQQYAFEVDMDVCTGCKACVSACHSLNGLDDNEAWRSVGLLHGGTAKEPAQQTVTTSCHHCVEPACMHGCPVKAYEKDPVTGIVKHLDDQCIGCQYCTLMCPYDAPKYNAKLGIVRKCDMCSDRLAVGEAPACVQACPNGAIKFAVVDVSEAVQRGEAGTFLPGAPAPDQTIPTTLYKSKKGLPGNMLPADFYSANPEHSHPPLVVMLTLTQLAAGAFAMATLVENWAGKLVGGALPQAIFSLGLGLVAIIASVFHLGRPQHAWKAFLGLKTSWLSREIVAFGGFAGLGVLYGVCLVPDLWPSLPGKDLLLASAPVIRILAAGAGVLGVFCSVMVYAATKRPHWSGAITGMKFMSTTMILGAATVAAIATATGGSHAVVKALLMTVMGVSVAKMAFEAGVFRHRYSRQHTVLRRMALLMTGELAMFSFLRFAAGLAGGVGLPLLALTAKHGADQSPAVAVAGAILSLFLLLVGEFAERYLFFRAAPGSRMPGGLR